MSEETKAIVEAIQDLTRVVMSTSDKFKTSSEAVRKLDELGVPTGRIAGIMGMASKDVSSITARAHKKHNEEHTNDEK